MWKRFFGTETTTYASIGVDGAPVDIEELLCVHLGALVGDTTRAVEDTAKHVLGDTELHAMILELNFGLLWSAAAKECVYPNVYAKGGLNAPS